MAQQTAVEWLATQIIIDKDIERKSDMDWICTIDVAKAMEKEQIIKAHGTKSNGRLKNDGQFIIGEITGEQYYNQTFNK